MQAHYKSALRQNETLARIASMNLPLRKCFGIEVSILRFMVHGENCWCFSQTSLSALHLRASPFSHVRSSWTNRLNDAS